MDRNTGHTPQMVLRYVQSFRGLDQWQRRAVGYLGVVFAALVLTALGYQWGMTTYEGRPRTFLDSLQFAVEMFTTTGFGGDAPWTSPQMQLFITVADLLGMVLLVGALPVFVGPFVETVLSSDVPRELDSSLSGHVVVCSDTTRAQELIRDLDSHGVPYVFVEPDEQRAAELHGRGQTVIQGDPEATADLAAANLPTARALFADVSDRTDASIVLAAREVAADVPVVSVVEDPDAAAYHQLAGADHVLTPRVALGEALAGKVTTVERAGVDKTAAIGDGVRLAEVSIRHGSRLAGARLADSGIREETGATVVGLWTAGEFHPAPSPDTRLPAGSVLLVSGHARQLDRLSDTARSPIREFQTGETIVVGYGQVGRAVAAELDEAGVPHTIVDCENHEGVDVVGDATDTETLTAAGIDEAATVILALPDDTTTEFATLVVRDAAPRTQILARVEDNSNVSKTHRAGADYVLSLASVTGRLSASRLLDDEDTVASTGYVDVVRVTAPGLAGRTIGDAAIRERTGCTVVAVERSDEVISDVTPETTVEHGDEVVVLGTPEAIQSFEETFQ